MKAFLEELKITETEPKAVLKKLQSFTAEEIIEATKGVEAVNNFLTMFYFL